jgi:hypothetical protein
MNLLSSIITVSLTRFTGWLLTLISEICRTIKLKSISTSTWRSCLFIYKYQANVTGSYPTEWINQESSP